jgi:dTMP kinase
LRRHREGFLLTIEHADGVGGTALRDAVSERLEIAGFDVVRTFQPGGTEFGTEIRRLLGLSGETPWKLSKSAELLLYEADRAQQYKEVLKPALRDGKMVVCDRYLDSTLAYQGHGRGFSIKLLLGLHNLATGMLIPDLTVIVDGSSRRDLSEGDRFERDTALQVKVRNAYLQMAIMQDRYFLVDGSRDLADLVQDVYERVEARSDEVRMLK